MRFFKVFVISILLGCLLCEAFAFPPERRRRFEERQENVYLILPLVASLPGIGVFLGVVASASNIAGTGIDSVITKAESIDSSDISVDAAVIRELPLLPPWFKLEYIRANIRLGNYQQFIPGRNSPNFTVPVTGEFDIQVVTPSLFLWDRRIQLRYRLSFFNGFEIDQDGREVVASNHSANADLNLDFTDDVLDPRSGIKIHYNTTLDAPTKSSLGEDSEAESSLLGGDLTVQQLEIAGYIPATDRLTLVTDFQYFQATGGENSDRVISGGSPPLRGFPQGRWRDRYGVFLAFEPRYTFPLNKQVDALLAQGQLEGIQLAVFYEVGQVAPKANDELTSELHVSTGAGLRMLLEAIVLRFDVANSDEGTQTYLTIDQPF